jgi:hypothetical protein
LHTFVRQRPATRAIRWNGRSALLDPPGVNQGIARFGKADFQAFRVRP